MTKLLDGVKVLDLSNVLSGPFCSFQLALLGATVIKVERPVEGDLARKLGEDKAAAERLLGSTFVATNCGKKSITLNLKTDAGKDIFLKLVREVDVLLENFRPGVMERLGLGHERLSEVNPSLVYCAITGFGQNGPLADRPAYDQIIQGMSGVMSITGDANTGPLRTGFPLCDTIGGLTGAFAICAGLLQARHNGKGSYLDVSMLESTLSAMGWVVSNYLNAGVEPLRHGNENITSSPSGTFLTRDKPINIAANEDHQYISLCEIIGRPDLIDDPRYRTRRLRKQNRASLKAELEQALQRRDCGTWQALFDRAGIPAGPLLTVPEILQHVQLAARSFVQHPPREVKQNYVRTGFQVDGASPAVDGGAPPLSRDTECWLRAVGLDEADILRLRQEQVI